MRCGPPDAVLESCADLGPVAGAVSDLESVDNLFVQVAVANVTERRS
jgi:hypothetical protein